MVDTSADRIAAIRRALAHPQFYDGDIGADIRWLLSDNEMLRQHAESHKRDYELLARKLDEAEREVAHLERVLVRLRGAR